MQFRLAVETEMLEGTNAAKSLDQNNGFGGFDFFRSVRLNDQIWREPMFSEYLKQK